MNFKMLPAALGLLGAGCLSDKNHEPADFSFNAGAHTEQDGIVYSIEDAPWNTAELSRGRTKEEQRMADAVAGLLEFLDDDH